MMKNKEAQKEPKELQQTLDTIMGINVDTGFRLEKKPKQLTDLEIAIKLDELDKELEDAAMDYISFKSERAREHSLVYKAIKFGAKFQAERMFSDQDLLKFAWFLIENIGQYSDDRAAHFEGKYLEQFKKSNKWKNK